MKELKFRIWDKEEKTFVVDIFYELQDWIISYIMARNDENSLYFQKHYELMQYTGLKDIYGKEIYEGDIVKFVCEITDPYEIGDLYEIESIEQFFSLRFYDSITLNLDQLGFEIIGNIYENPSLLEKLNEGT